MARVEWRIMTTRLYLDFTSADKTIALPVDESHYLTRVLRLKVGDIVHVYNEHAGEWSAVLSEVTKSLCVLTAQQQLRMPVAEPITRLIYAQLKHDAMTFLLEKATELGVTHLQPMATDFAQKYNVHIDKIVRQLKQASQQSERLSVPTLLPVMAFDAVVSACYVDVTYIALERADVPSFTHALNKKEASEPCTFIIGPEGGFSHREVELVKRMPNIQQVSLGRTILRAETAAIVGMGAISMWRG
jgi:16S rRNA (uracil1498-N3)-methyltransferase